MKSALVIAALCLLPAAPCLAQQAQLDQSSQPASAADIERYFEVMHLRQQMKDTLAAVSTEMRQIMNQQLQKAPNLPPDAEKQMNEFYDTELQKLPTEQILETAIPVYQKYLSEGDVDALFTHANLSSRRMAADRR